MTEIADMAAAPYPRATRVRYAARGPAGVAFWAIAESWWGTAVIVLVGAALGGYLGATSGLYAWACARGTVLDRSQSVRRRTSIGLLALASAAILYLTVLNVLRVVMP